MPGATLYDRVLAFFQPASAEARMWPMDDASRRLIEQASQNTRWAPAIEAAQRDPRDVYISTLPRNDPTIAGEFFRDRGTGENRILLYGQAAPDVLAHEALHFLGRQVPGRDRVLEESMASTMETGRKRTPAEEALYQRLLNLTRQQRQKR